jgi:hypothetical protein
LFNKEVQNIDILIFENVGVAWKNFCTMTSISLIKLEKKIGINALTYFLTEINTFVVNHILVFSTIMST